MTIRPLKNAYMIFLSFSTISLIIFTIFMKLLIFLLLLNIMINLFIHFGICTINIAYIIIIINTINFMLLLIYYLYY